MSPMHRFLLEYLLATDRCLHQYSSVLHPGAPLEKKITFSGFKILPISVSKPHLRLKADRITPSSTSRAFFAQNGLP